MPASFFQIKEEYFMQKEKDMQPPQQDEREGLSIEDIANQASLKETDEIQRESLRGDETEGDADERDAAGRSASKDTPHGREETKNDVKGKANTNG